MEDHYYIAVFFSISNAAVVFGSGPYLKLDGKTLGSLPRTYFHRMTNRSLASTSKRVRCGTCCFWWTITWAPAGMAKRGTCPLWKCCKVFCALVVSAKCSADELFMHYFHNLRSASGSFGPRPPPGLHSWTPLRDFRPQTPNLFTPGQNSVGTHGRLYTF